MRDIEGQARQYLPFARHYMCHLYQHSDNSIELCCCIGS